eukprot:TRINITY_DN13420_c0_g1_i1.p1 TRINITY_DN13420_c0_g1~~TRINITY_DN13420_c0_g1_i1.p1  ORF type:complete len:305 (+),score=36.22 TRINITY_DN13420_c0_g1_i1:28-942(+)
MERISGGGGGSVPNPEKLPGGGGSLSRAHSNNSGEWIRTSGDDWLDADFLSELGVNMEDKRIHAMISPRDSTLGRDSKFKMSLELRRALSGHGETPTDLWLALEDDLQDLEGAWKDRFQMSARTINPNEVYSYDCAYDGKHRARLVNDEMYCCKKQLAGGSFGNLHAAQCKKTLKRVAIKSIQCRDTVWSRLSREVFSGFNVKHPCLINIHEIYLWDHQVHMVMDLIESCDPHKTRVPDLFSFLTVIRDSQPLNEFEVALVVYQVACAVSYLNQRLGAIHRDLKPENILVGLSLIHISEPTRPY